MINGIRADKQKIELQRNSLQEEVAKEIDAHRKGLNALSIQQLQDLGIKTEETGERIIARTKEAEELIKDLQKKRIKLSDADIIDNFKIRADELSEANNKLQNLAKETEAL